MQDAQSVLGPGSILLALLSIASVAVLVGRRLSEYTRRVGLLKAVGGTPAVIALTFLAENLALALISAVVGLVAGWLAAPLLTNPGAGLIGSAGAPSITATTALLVVGLAIVVALAATLVPALRAARSSTVGALSDVSRIPKRHGLVVRVSRVLPVSLLFGLRLFGLRLVARRPRRALLTTANVAVTVTGVVAVVAFYASVHSRLSKAATSGLTTNGLSDPVINRDEQMLAVITVLLVALAALNAIFSTWATVRDARAASALMRALGARTRQVGAGLTLTQVLSALPGTLLGVPLGLLLIAAADKGNGVAPPVWWLVVTVLGTLLLLAALTTIPARIGARHPLTEVLQAEAT